MRIPRTYAIATTEVTNEQFARFLAAAPAIGARWKAAAIARFGDPPRIAVFSRTPDSPQVAVSWYDAAQYCNWLSERDGLPKSQWVYPENIDASARHRVAGRLPAPHWDIGFRPKLNGNTLRAPVRPRVAISAMMTTSWIDMRGTTAPPTASARFPSPSCCRISGACSTCSATCGSGRSIDGSPTPPMARITEDVEDSTLRVSNDIARTRRGGSFAYEWFTARSAHRGDVTYFPNQTRDNVGFRVARTMP